MSRIYACDFETTVYDGQKRTDVWSAGIAELYTDNVVVFNSIRKFFNFIVNLNQDMTLYYHNVKFDGSFIIDYLMLDLGYKLAYNTGGFTSDKVMAKKSFKCSISDKGQWYSITIKTPKNKLIKIYDSYKLIPQSLGSAAKSFGTKHKKLDMVYEGYREPDGVITQEEVKYLKNDVLVLKELLEIFFGEGHNKITIGACCMAEYKKIVHQSDNPLFANLGGWDKIFPDLTKIRLNKDVYGSDNADDYVRKSYRGGWCYVKKDKANKLQYNGCTVDFNSMYPSKMHSSSGCYYPYGKPQFFRSNIPDIAKQKNRYYFVRLRCQFKLKDGYLPFVQIKNSFLYRKNECLETSDVYDEVNNCYLNVIPTKDGDLVPATVTLTLSQTDYKLFLAHYDVYNVEILDGCYFKCVSGLFDEYIDKYKDIKMTSTGSKREIAKLFLNNLYGKFGTNPNSSYKVPYINDKGYISFKTVIEFNKKTVYVPVAAATTSYARYECIQAAQKNYDNFIYADTDSMHLHCPIDCVKSVSLHPTDFNCWAHELSWTKGLFVRQKTYLEVFKNKDGVMDIDVKCAGMPDRCKDIFASACGYKRDIKKIKQNEQKYIKNGKSITDFKYGLIVPSKLSQVRMRGGVVLHEGDYTMTPVKPERMYDKVGNLKEVI